MSCDNQIKRQICLWLTAMLSGPSFQCCRPLNHYHLVFSIQAMAFIGHIFGSLCAWPAADYFGRQTALKLGGIVSLCGWLFLYNSIRVTESAAGFQALLFTGRILTGFAAGWFFPTVAVSMCIHNTQSKVF